jgi:hypothetical protein
MSVETIPARVARGAALLDEKLPGWIERIDLDELDLANCFGCVLGQTFFNEWDEAEYTIHAECTPYDFGASELFDIEASYASVMLAREPGVYGFTGVPEETDKERAFDALTAEWKRVILARRAGSEARDDH